MPDQHAYVTASGSSRWINCPPSVALEAKFPDTSSEAAKEGTEAHALAEKKVIAWLKGDHAQEASDRSMEEAVTAYRDYIISISETERRKGGLGGVMVERRLDLSRWIPGGFGTSDACIVSERHLHIVDLKYGKGVKVDARNNSQMRLYALGAIDELWPLYEFDSVTMHIFQPRLDNVSTETMTVAELLEWGEKIKPLAHLAYQGQGVQKPGSWCKFCRAQAVCKARADRMFAVIDGRQSAELLSLDDVAGLLPDLDDVISWAKSVQEYAFNKALAGETITGYKLVEGRSVREITDKDAMAKRLKADGYKDEEIFKPVQLNGLTALEKLIGKKAFAENYASFICKPKGKPTLVSADDRRKEWSNDQTIEEMFKKGE